MIYYTKNGSIPYPITDGTEGWTEAPAPPECPEGKEVVWWGYEWVIRDPKPQDRPGYQWNWQHDARQWVEGAWGNEVQPVEITPLEVAPMNFTSSQVTL